MRTNRNTFGGSTGYQNPCTILQYYIYLLRSVQQHLLPKKCYRIAALGPNPNHMFHLHNSYPTVTNATLPVSVGWPLPDVVHCWVRLPMDGDHLPQHAKTPLRVTANTLLVLLLQYLGNYGGLGCPRAILCKFYYVKWDLLGGNSAKDYSLSNLCTYIAVHASTPFLCPSYQINGMLGFLNET